MATKLLVNIDEKYNIFLNSLTKNSKLTKRKIIEDSLDLKIEQMKQLSLSRQYEEMKKDTEYLEEMVSNAEYLSFL
jgi:hypothetical protein